MEAPRLGKDVWTLPKVATGGSWFFRAFWAALLVLVALSRFLFLPEGPWEQDEALLACGVVDFDPGHHMPHPPGFPLWIWIGRTLVACGVSDPLRALQVASSLFSTLAFVLLASFWQRWVGGWVAAAGAFLASFLPGVWFHAHRGFSETAAASLFLLALLIWQRGSRNQFLGATLALLGAGLVRPPLLPFFAVVGLCWGWQYRRQVRELGRVALVGTTFVVVVMTPLVLEAGGFGPFWQALTTHAGEHAFLLGTEGLALAQLGFVKGLGGLIPAAGFLLAALLGWGALRQKVGPKPWFLASLLSLWLCYLLVFTHNSTYPRYWVPAFLCAAVPALYGVQVLLRQVGLVVGVGLLAAACFAWWTWPAVRYVHAKAIPAVAAFTQLPSHPEATVVYQDELFSFRTFLVRTKRLSQRPMRWSEVQAPKFTLGGAKLFLVTENAPTYLPSSVSREIRFSVEEPRVVYLSQGRFLAATLVANPVLLYAGGSIREVEERSQDTFVWLYPEAVILLPALTGAGQVALAVELPPGLPNAPVVAWVEGLPLATVQLAPGRQVLNIPLPEVEGRKVGAKVVPLKLLVGAMRKLPGDGRPLALKVRYLSLEAPPWTPLPYSFTPAPERLHAATVTATGLYGMETFTGVPGAWTQPRCTFVLPVSAGRLQLWLSAPRPGGARAVLQLGEARLSAYVPPRGSYLELPIPLDVSFATRLRLEIEADPYTPPNDPRELGVVVHGVRFEPGLPPVSLDRLSPLPFPLTR